MSTPSFFKLVLSLAIVLSSFGYVVPASAAPPQGGLLLTDTDAAYADWVDEEIGGCYVSLFVGFVKAGGLQNPLGSKPIRPHSDVQAILTANCTSPVSSWTLEGTIPARDCASAPVMVSLESASVSCDLHLSDIDVGTDAAEAEVEIDLLWTADGNVFTEIVNNPGMHATHRTSLAALDGSVSIDVTRDDTGPLFGDFELDAGDVDDAPRLTHFNEIQIARP